MRHIRRFVLAMALLGCIPTIGSPARDSDEIHFDRIRDSLLTELAKNNVRSVAVADFACAGAADCTLGWYLAQKLSRNLESKPHSFRNLNRDELESLKVSPDEISSPDLLKRVCSLWGVDAIVTGIVSVSADQYIVNISLRRITDSSEFLKDSQPLARSKLLDQLAPPDPASKNLPVRAGVPICQYCPVPPYPGHTKIQQNVSIEIMVTFGTTGAPEKISITKSPMYVLSEGAVQAVSSWKAQPALGKDGKPVATKVPVQVTFGAVRN
jgi:Gram-negative bacterial TonB protein C-terminal